MTKIMLTFLRFGPDDNLSGGKTINQVYVREGGEQFPKEGSFRVGGDGAWCMRYSQNMSSSKSSFDGNTLHMDFPASQAWKQTGEATQEGAG